MIQETPSKATASGAKQSLIPCVSSYFIIVYSLLPGDPSSFLGLRQRVYTSADPNINGQADLPPRSPASSILYNEHPVSGVMNQEFEQKSVVWLVGFSNAVNFKHRTW